MRATRLVLARRVFVLTYAADVAVDVIEGRTSHYREPQWWSLVWAVLLAGPGVGAIGAGADSGGTEGVDGEWPGAGAFLLLGTALLVAAVPFVLKARGLLRPVTVDRLEVGHDTIVWRDDRGNEPHVVPRAAVRDVVVGLWLSFGCVAGKDVEPIPLRPYDRDEVRAALDRHGWEQRRPGTDVIEGRARYYRERQWACLVGALVLVGLGGASIVTWANASRTEDVDNPWLGARPFLVLGITFVVAALPFLWHARRLRRPLTVDRLEISRDAIVWKDRKGSEPRIVARASVRYCTHFVNWLRFESATSDPVDSIPIHPFDADEVREALDRHGWERRLA